MIRGRPKEFSFYFIGLFGRINTIYCPSLGLWLAGNVLLGDEEKNAEEKEMR